MDVTDPRSENSRDVRWAVIILLALSMIFFTALGSFHLFDWDEVNFAESAREMLVTGEYLNVQIDFQPFWEKPPFFFWLQAISMKIFGVNEFAARFPNAVFGVIYLLTFYFIGRRWHGHRFGLMWALLYFGTLLPHIYFRTGIIDPVFNYFILLSVYLTGLVAEGKAGNRGALLAGIMSGMSVITKGPVGFLVLLLTAGVVFVFRRFRGIPAPARFLFFFSGLVLPVSIWLGAELYFHGTEIIGRFVTYQIELFNRPVAGHGQPFYYHFVVVFLGCFPASVFGLSRLITHKNDSDQAWMSVWMRSLFWVVLILFSLSTTKIIHYSSLTWPPLVYLAVRLLSADDFSMRPLASTLYLILALFWTIILTAIPYLAANIKLIMPYIHDNLTKDMLSSGIELTGFEAFGGLFFGAACTVIFKYLKRRDTLKALAMQAVVTGIVLTYLAFTVVPAIEGITQGPAIRFLKSIKGQDVYVSTYKFKSYAPYFYSDKTPDLTLKGRDESWLLRGDTDKPVYMIARSTNTDIDSMPWFKLTAVEGGFRIYKREAVKPAIQ